MDERAIVITDPTIGIVTSGQIRFTEGPRAWTGVYTRQRSANCLKSSGSMASCGGVIETSIAGRNLAAT